MVRTYQRKYTSTRNGTSHPPYLNYSEEDLQKAIEAVQDRSCILNEAAKIYNIPVSTLSRKSRHQNCTQEKAGHPTLFSKEEEKSFVEYIKLLSHWGFPLDIMDLRVFAQNYLNRIGKIIYTLNDNMPGIDWARNFLNRHKCQISNRITSNISSDRAKTTTQVIDDFFENYAKSIEGVTPDCLINYDEMNLTDDPGNKKHIFKRECKYPERVNNSSKSSISLMFAGTADGQSLPIYVVYKADHLWDQWLEGAPVGTIYNRSKSGWFDSVCFEDWFNEIVVPYAIQKSGKKVLIGDNLSSHFSQSVLQTCNELNIIFVCLPPKTTHLLQPLDVAFGAPLNKYWRDVLTKWKKTEGMGHQTLVKSSFPKLLKKLKDKLVENDTESRNLIAGFNKCGLYPINSERPKSRLQQINIISKTTSLVVIDILQPMRSPSVSEPTIRKKKWNVPPGKSRTVDNLECNQTKKDKLKKKRKNTQPGSSGLCNAYEYDSSDDQRTQQLMVIETSKKPKIEEYVSIKGKGKGKRTKTKIEEEQIKIRALGKKMKSEKGNKTKPKIKNKQIKIRDLKNFDLEPVSIKRLKASVKAEKFKSKNTEKESTDSDTTSVSDVMRVHSDSDVIDVDFGDDDADVKSDSSDCYSIYYY